MTAQLFDVVLTRHDASLLGIATLLLAGVLLAYLSSVGLTTSLFLVSIPAAACIVYVLFYRPPEEIPTE